MDSDQCTYDCSQRPDHLNSDPDISGIGINLAYNITAFLALSVVLSYYVIAYRPEVDPFHRVIGTGNSHNTPVYQPNPVDVRLLRWRAKWARSDSQSNTKLTARTRRVASALTQSMLMMSDLQLLTGLGILMSGFARLRCGISTYHWQRIVNLAWFSGVTHLCCLTFLRRHLRRNKNLQIWRIPGMIALTLMLMAALITTLSYEWRFGWAKGEVTPYDQAVCFLRPTSKTNRVSGAGSFQRTVISLIMISFGMINRIARLYERPYNFVIKGRARFSRLARMILDYNHRKCSSNSVISSARAVFVYRPLLGLFLLARVLLDILTSKAFEAWWLLQAFLLGTLKLWWRAAVPEPESKQWRFGQILAVVLLVSPALSLVEGWNNKNILASPEQTPTSNPVSTIRLVTLQQDESSPTDATTANRISLKGPNYDFYNACWAFTPLICSCFGVSMAILVVVTIMPVSPLSYFSALAGATSPLLLIVYTYFLVLVSIILSTNDSNRPRRRSILWLPLSETGYQRTWQSGIFMFYSVFLTAGGLVTGSYEANIGMLRSSLVLYPILAIYDEVRLWKIGTDNGTP